MAILMEVQRTSCLCLPSNPSDYADFLGQAYPYTPERLHHLRRDRILRCLG